MDGLPTSAITRISYDARMMDINNERSGAGMMAIRTVIAIGRWVLLLLLALLLVGCAAARYAI